MMNFCDKIVFVTENNMNKCSFCKNLQTKKFWEKGKIVVKKYCRLSKDKNNNDCRSFIGRN